MLIIVLENIKTLSARITALTERAVFHVDDCQRLSVRLRALSVAMQDLDSDTATQNLGVLSALHGDLQRAVQLVEKCVDTKKRKAKKFAKSQLAAGGAGSSGCDVGEVVCTGSAHDQFECLEGILSARAGELGVQLDGAVTSALNRGSYLDVHDAVKMIERSSRERSGSFTDGSGSPSGASQQEYRAMFDAFMKMRLKARSTVVEAARSSGDDANARGGKGNGKGGSGAAPRAMVEVDTFKYKAEQSDIDVQDVRPDTHFVKQSPATRGGTKRLQGGRVGIRGNSITSQRLFAECELVGWDSARDCRWRWQRTFNKDDWRDVPGANTPSYRCSVDDVGALLRLSVRVADSTTYTSDAVCVTLQPAVQAKISELSREGFSRFLVLLCDRERDRDAVLQVDKSDLRLIDRARDEILVEAPLCERVCVFVAHDRTHLMIHVDENRFTLAAQNEVERDVIAVQLILGIAKSAPAARAAPPPRMSTSLSPRQPETSPRAGSPGGSPRSDHSTSSSRSLSPMCAAAAPPPPPPDTQLPLAVRPLDDGGVRVADLSVQGRPYETSTLQIKGVLVGCRADECRWQWFRAPGSELCGYDSLARVGELSPTAYAAIEGATDVEYVVTPDDVHSMLRVSCTTPGGRLFYGYQFGPITLSPEMEKQLLSYSGVSFLEFEVWDTSGKARTLQCATDRVKVRSAHRTKWKTSYSPSFRVVPLVDPLEFELRDEAFVKGKEEAVTLRVCTPRDRDMIVISVRSMCAARVKADQECVRMQQVTA